MSLRQPAITALVLLAASGPAAPAPAQPHREPPAPLHVNPGAQLLITDLSVVEDPVRTDPRGLEPGAWTFRHLARGLAGDGDPAELVLRWLESWEEDQHVGGRTSPARPRIRELVIDPWLQASGGAELDLRRAPFRLLAIVNRMDLRAHDGPDVRSAGEGRFVFGLTSPDGTPLPPQAGPAPGGFLVIFEYELVARDMSDLREWTRLWMELGAHPVGSPAYLDRLEAVTRRFSDPGRAPGKVNDSALNQIRTNEIALAPSWELREFALDPRSGRLEQRAVAQTPDVLELNGTPELARLVNANEREIREGSFDVPDGLLGPSSLAGPFVDGLFPADRTIALRELAPGLFDAPWSAEGIRDNDARHAFALNTCNGCHRSETGTGFVQVGFPVDHELPESLGRPATLAGFLTGIVVPDPVDPVATRTFADLERRRLDLLELARSFGAGGRGEGPVRERRRPRFVH